LSSAASIEGQHPDRRCKTGQGLVQASLDGNSNSAWNNLERIFDMLYTIAVVLVILWLLGLVTSYTMGGFIHILLVIAIVSILFNVISGRRSG
jgi:mannose/fructose/N-acetylgalactosamine-specific phosphotransferase system component IID